MIFKRINKKTKTNVGRAGFTLMEMLVATTLFVVIIMSSADIFRLVAAGQRKAIDSQNVQESLKYFLEVIGKEIRMAQRDNGVCPMVPDDQIFYLTNNTRGDVLYFKNYHGQCVHYYLFPYPATNSLRFTIGRDSDLNFISPFKIDISDLKFIVSEEADKQAVVTMSFQASAVVDSVRRREEMRIQTTITSRYYKND